MFTASACVARHISPLLSSSLQLASAANATALRTLAGALALNSSAAGLAAKVSTTNESLSSLERNATTDSQAIAVANDTATRAMDTASDLLRRIAHLNTRLAELGLNLNATVLVSPARLNETGGTVEQLEREVIDNRDTVAAVQNKIDDLEQSALELRARYRALQQHREVLQGILSNIETLNCREQFVSSS